MRPVLDFASPTYHALLSKSQTIQLEALQKRAAKIIFGVGSSYSDIVKEGKMVLLEERRKDLCLKFARKAAASSRFGKEWFPEKQMNK